MLHGRRILFVGITFGLVATVGLAVARSHKAVAAEAESLPPRSSATADVEAILELPPFHASGDDSVVRRTSQLHTDRPERGRLTVLEYSVQRGDTAWSIAQQCDLQPETILWGNADLSAEAGSLQVGQTLDIPPVDGVLHTVQEGDSLDRLAALYGASIEAILEFPGNGFTPHVQAKLDPGQQIVIPGGRKPIGWIEPGPRVVAGLGRRSPGFYSGPLVYVGTGFFAWPVSPIRITQYFWSGHPAIDLDTYLGQPVFASDSGTVIYSDWDTTGYGNLVILDHGNGYWTYYAHNDANLVGPGDGVLQGQEIAESGSTGNSTGEHLDFRIRLAEGGFLDPLDYLP
jgi:murein DD-endopeptidase MepM/ murein hydrolase activator NlpD